MLSTSNFEKEIARLAYRFWEEEGRPEGRAEAHWLRAAAEVNIPNLDPGTPSKTVKASKKTKSKG